MIKNLLTAPFCALCYGATAQSTNVLLFTRFQWSTNNGVSWAEDIQINPDFVDVAIVPVGGDNQCFFKSDIADNGNLDVWHSFIVTSYAGFTVDAITNPIATNTFYVFPNVVAGYGTNVIYRSMMSLTNYAAPVFGTNSVVSTNLPSPP